LQSSFSICLFCSALLFEQLLAPSLEGTSAEPDQLALDLPADPETSAPQSQYHCKRFDQAEQLWLYLENHSVDCLVLQASSELQPLLAQLQQRGFFYPSVILNWTDLVAEPLAEAGDSSPSAPSDWAADGPFSYHEAVVLLPWEKRDQIRFAIAQAISQFVHLKPDPVQTPDSSNSLDSLMTQQLRLADKLKERLDYLGVYYKRNPQHFIRHMSPPEREELLRQLELEYRDIVLAYFSDEARLNAMIDQFVNLAFFSDVPISQIVQIHMNLMDEFSKHLKLEGRSEEVLLDYRLTLIDTLAHLCEMYRRSIPRES
jgi:circadian clock protein KaiA